MPATASADRTCGRAPAVTPKAAMAAASRPGAPRVAFLEQCRGRRQISP